MFLLVRAHPGSPVVCEGCCVLLLYSLLLVSDNQCKADPSAAEFGRRRQILSLGRKSAEKNSARPTIAFLRRRWKKISPVKLNAFLMTSSAQNNSAIQR